ncbi:aldo/keto reductase [Candidatus Bipolaricaulota bacterium]|nr:aldo/keto reductase [Candidatus Bipolaricaulota bacterium]
MEKVRLGRTELQVTRIGFGGIPIQRVGDDDAMRIIRRVFDLGVNFFDTANGYGTSEERIGRALQDERNSVILATKTPARDRDGALKHLELSLKRLRTDTIDLWQFHNVSNEPSYAEVTGPRGALEAAREALAGGVVKHIGLTSHSMDIALKATASDLFETIQFPFNYVTREAEDALIPLANKHDVGFIGMKPFAGGLLSDARLSIKYVLQWDTVVPDPGIETIADIEGIVDIVNGDRQLTNDERNEIERIRNEVGHRFCRRCGYCLPCPAQIPIPVALNIVSFIRRFPTDHVLSDGFSSVATRAAACLKCGACEARCPYGLPIREMLAENVQAYKDLTA